MTVAYDFPARKSSVGTMSCLEDRFEVIKEIGDGSFGSVHLARVRTAGSSIAKRGTMIAIKTMKKTFESFAPCLELREVIFLRSLPSHVHLVPALDIFLDPTTKKLHIAMEFMDGNLYQLMKARDHRPLDGASVKSILFQILSGLDHIHTNQFFHRDIKPENILISTSAPQDSGINLRRYSAMATPPSTPPTYSVKLADFGLARETHSRLPYTTYVSTRWYRAPEVLLRAGEYSAPVDIWALGAMAVEIATLKPLFPGGNEVDQVWRVCEIMGSPGNWYNKAGHRVGGGEWRDGTKLAQKLGFSFPKMAPHAMDTILQTPQWPAALSDFVTWCLMWDPKGRPTSHQAMCHDYFVDAVDPLMRPKSNRLMGRKTQPAPEAKSTKETVDQPVLTTRASWFRKSFVGRDSNPPVPHPNPQLASPRPSPVHQSNSHPIEPASPQHRPNAGKRTTWTNGPSSLVAPMPILPSIRPVSPLSNAVTAEARSTNYVDEQGKNPHHVAPAAEKKKIGRQLSVASHGNHYGDREGGNGGIASPTNGQKESFFSHLRKRARRFSGRNHLVASPKYDDVEANLAMNPNRSSMVAEPVPIEPSPHKGFTELDRALQNVKYNLNVSPQPHLPPQQQQVVPGIPVAPSNPLSAVHTQPHVAIPTPRAVEEPLTPGVYRSSSRTRRNLQLSAHPSFQYETPDEEDELLDEALHGVSGAMRRLEGQNRKRHAEADGFGYRNALAHKDLNRQPPPPALHHSVSTGAIQNPYPTPSPSAKRSGVLYNNALLDEPATPININRPRKESHHPAWPTPPYEENEWAASAAAQIFAAGSAYR